MKPQWELSQFVLGMAVGAAAVLVMGLFSEWTKRKLWISEPLAALLFGILLGPVGLGILRPADWPGAKDLLWEASSLTLAVGLMDVALRIGRFPIERWRGVLLLLVLMMTCMWAVSSLVVWLVAGASAWVALLLGGVVTATDPVVANAIVTGVTAERNLPLRLRHAISSESGANDGLAYAFVMLPVLMMKEAGPSAFGEWVVRVILWEVGVATVVGAAMGFVAARMLLFAERKGSIMRSSFLAYSIALAIAAIGVTRLLGTDGVLGTFAAGLAFSVTVGGADRSSEESVEEVVNKFFFLPVFLMLGVMLPWGEWGRLGWRAPVLAAAILAFRRLPAMLALWPLMRVIGSRREALFAGWFGPIGVSAIFYALLAERRTGDSRAWVFGSLIVAASLLVHGASATPLTRFYGSRGGGTVP